MTHHKEGTEASEDLESKLKPKIKKVWQDEWHGNGEDGGSCRDKAIDNAHSALEVVAQHHQGRGVS